MSRVQTILVRVGLPVTLLGVGLGVGAALYLTEEPPQRADEGPRGVLVSTREARLEQRRRELVARGEVRPSRSVVIRPEVVGRVVEVHPELMTGGRVERGAVLLRIDPAEFRLLVDEAETALVRARAELEIEKARQEVAEREWEEYREERDPVDADPSLVKRQPQLRAAQVAVRAAEARLARARLDLERSRLVAPFDALVLREDTEVGALVGPEAAIATLVATDAYWAEVVLPLADVAALRVPRPGDGATGSRATIVQTTERGRIEREGRVLRLLGSVDPAGRMARLLLRIDDPLGDATAPSDELPILLGAYVEARIEGRSEEQVVAVPASAVRDGDSVWVYGPDDTLDIREVTIAWRDDGTVYVRDGLLGEERVVTSPIGSPIQGMRLRRDERRRADDGTGGTADG